MTNRIKPNRNRSFSAIYFRILFATLILTASLAFTTGCLPDQTPPGEIVARVKDRVLTQSEVKAWETSLHRENIPPELRLSFIRNWVEKELIYQEALREGLAEDPAIIEQLKQLKRDFLIAKLYEIVIMDQAPPDEKAIKKYFLEHSNEFVWENVHLKCEYWRSETNDGMDQLRKNLIRGIDDAIWTGKPNSLDHGVISVTGEENAGEDVWRIISRLKERELSSIARINGSFWIFRVVRRCSPGEPKTIEDVEAEIISRLNEEFRRRKREEMIRELVEEYKQNGWLQWSDARSVVTIIDSTGKGE